MAEMTPITPDMQPIPPEGGDGAPFIADRLRNDQVESAPTANWTPAAIIALIALILFAVTLVIVWQDYSFLSQA